MSDSTLGRYYSLNKCGIDPRFYPDEPFYYYNLPDFDTGGKVALSLGKSIDSNKFLVQQGSLLISKLNPRIKRVWLVRNDGSFRSITSTEFVSLIPNDNALVDYLFYFLQQDSLFRQLESEAVGTTNSHVRFKPDLLCRILGELPPLPQQRKIAQILTTVDNLIEKTEALIAKYQAIKQGMMHDLFTRGVDEHGHLRPPYEEAPELYKQSELGWIPKEWEVEASGSISREIVVGIVVRPVQYYRPEGVPVLRSANVRINKVVSDDLVFMSENDNEALSKSQVNTGDVVTVRTGVGVGSTAVIPAHFDGCNCVDIVITRPKRERIRPEFLSMWINSPQGYTQILAGQGGLAQQHFNVGEMRLMQVKVPPLGEQDVIVASIVSQQSSLEKNVETVEKLRSLKTGLMQDLLTGKVRVKADESEEVAAHD